jgi:endonuclease-8
VESEGKNVLMHFSHGYTLVTHMRMTGVWHVYAQGERWRKSPGAARVVVDAGDVVAVCFSAPTVEMHATRTLRSTSPVARLGPDLCHADADLREAASRLEMVPAAGVAIADALLDQRIASGVGNVYKSETLFACGIDPFTPAAALSEEQRRAVIETAATLLRRNLGAGPRTTTNGGLAVYGRAGRACRRCGTRIRSARQGPYLRTTYWCPSCQERIDG